MFKGARGPVVQYTFFPFKAPYTAGLKASLFSVSYTLGVKF